MDSMVAAGSLGLKERLDRPFLMEDSREQQEIKLQEEKQASQQQDQGRS